jgi:Holliday junction resolvasome RuvABC endonuclease subunit
MKKSDIPPLSGYPCYIGIDLSLKSPGITVLENSCNAQNWSLYGFHQHKKKYKDVKNPILTLFPAIPSAQESNNNMRYKHVSDHVCSIVAKYQKKYPHPDDIRVVVEGYAFKKESAHSSKLMEECGILKYRLFYEHNITCQILPPTRWKKYGTGKGKRSKLETAIILRESTGIDLFQILGCKEKEKLDHPLEDIYDSIGLVKAMLYMDQYPHMVTQIKQKPKKNNPKKNPSNSTIDLSDSNTGGDSDTGSEGNDDDDKFNDGIQNRKLKRKKKAKKMQPKKMIQVKPLEERKQLLYQKLEQKQKHKRFKLPIMEDEFI